jgi:hypothetical protein
MTQTLVWNGVVLVHVQDQLPVDMELAQAPRDLNGIAQEEAVHILVTMIQLVSHLVLMNAHIPDKLNA